MSESEDVIARIQRQRAKDKRSERIYGACVALFAIGVIAALVFLGWRDHVATRKCHLLGGRTHDSGQHCTIGGYDVSTR